MERKENTQSTTNGKLSITKGKKKESTELEIIPIREKDPETTLYT